jgi:hypothetical protein
LTYFPAWNYLNFMGNSYLTFNNSTGELCICPTGPLLGNLTQIAVFAIMVEEWRDGVLIATTMRDIQVQAFECPIPEPLPVSLTDFTGRHESGVNYLKWITASEINADHFIVERSSEGHTFNSIGKVMAHGNSASINKYGFADYNALPIVNYYKLRSVDYDGVSKYSDVVVLYTGLEYDSSNLYTIDGRLVDSDKPEPGVYIRRYTKSGAAVHTKLILIQ